VGFIPSQPKEDRVATKEEFLGALKNALEQGEKLGMDQFESVKLFVSRLQTQGGLKHLAKKIDEFLKKL